MRISVILGHPDKGSFNHAIAGAALQTLHRNGHDVIFHDLYRERFDPILPAEEIPSGADVDQLIKIHGDEISSADGIIIIHPNWWGQPPAIVKGWVDRVFRAGIAYEFLDGDGGEGVPIGLLKAETAIVFNTSNTPKERELGVFKDPLETLWKNCIFDFCGVRNFHRRMFRIVITSTPEQRKSWLREAQEIVDRSFPG
ncbi:MAG: NAD(P)H-dependent oxidoreductase [bacterium]